VKTGPQLANLAVPFSHLISFSCYLPVITVCRASTILTPSVQSCRRRVYTNTKRRKKEEKKEERRKNKEERGEENEII
jgi:hypothetical protein